MGIPLMIQKADNERIENLKNDLGIHKKIEVIRAGLTLLEKEADRIKRTKQWKHAVNLAIKSSRSVNKEFQKNSRIKKD